MHVFDTLFFLIVFGAILFLAYVATRFVGAKTGKTMKGKNISIVETVSLGMDKQLHLVKVADQFVLISSSGKNVQFLTDVSMDSHTMEGDTGQSNVFEFKSLFEKYLSSFTVKKQSEEKINSRSSEGSSSESSIFRSNLNRLKGITTEMNISSTFAPKEGTKDVLDGVDYTNDK